MPKRLLVAGTLRVPSARARKVRLLLALLFLLAARPAPALAQTGGLALRPPELPPATEGSGLTNPIDLLLAPYLEEHELPAGRLVDDARFARRVYLDAIGLVPSAEELKDFVDDPRPDKRERLVDALLADRRRYAEHWLTFWNDALRNDYRGTGYIDGGRKQITDWLYAALENNMPYDQFVRELIDPSPASEGFIKGIVWRGVVNASQVPEVQAAQNVSQIFLGINLKCASCHDSFINHWTLVEAYGLANVFADTPLEMHRCDRPTGEMAQTSFLFPELGTVDADAPKDQRVEQLAKIITSPENGRLPRTIVNRLWAKFLGRGLVEPVDEMDNTPFHPGLLEWLAADLVEHRYDLKHTMRRIFTSRAYQLPSVDGSESAQQDFDFVFAGPVVRRMSAEQFLDAVSSLTGVWQQEPAALLANISAPAEPRPGEEHGSLKFASGVVNSGAVEIDVDIAGASTLWLVVNDAGNGATLDWADWAEPRLEGPAGTQRLTDLNWRSATSGYGKARVGTNIVDKPLVVDGRHVRYGIGTHANSVIVYDLPEGYTRFKTTAGPDSGAIVQSADGHDMEFLVLTDLAVRSSLVPADSLMVALGRPNREQVITSRPTAATTLQALELTNGPTLDEVLKQGARKWLAGEPAATEQATAEQLVERLYLEALGRLPAPDESATASELVGSPPTEPGLADLLWVIVMLPEFQLVY
ncbi:MAG: DUF1549 domain-containing protein [Pirellulales bacterium]